MRCWHRHRHRHRHRHGHRQALQWQQFGTCFLSLKYIFPETRQLTLCFCISQLLSSVLCVTVTCAIHPLHPMVSVPPVASGSIFLTCFSHVHLVSHKRYPDFSTLLCCYQWITSAMPSHHSSLTTCCSDAPLSLSFCLCVFVHFGSRFTTGNERRDERSLGK